MFDNKFDQSQQMLSPTSIQTPANIVLPVNMDEISQQKSPVKESMQSMLNLQQQEEPMDDSPSPPSKTA
jgi:hypothetical protein